MPKVSVTIPTYNRASLVEEAIRCVLDQTFDDLEIIVVDDGSTDNTRSVVEKYTEKGVKYCYKENGGCASARNFGLAQCSGQYIAFLDSDDLWPEDFIEIMLNRLEENPQYGCIYCSVVKMSPDGSQKNSYGPDTCKSGLITQELFKRSFIWLQTTLFRKDALDKFVFDDSLRNGADTDAILRLSTRIKFLYEPQIKVAFRENHGVSPRKDISSLNCNRIRVLERFYYRLGGDKYISKHIATHKISHAYRGVAKNYYKQNYRTAAIELYKRAICYLPTDIRLCTGLLKAYLLNTKNDPAPGWKMPEPLADIKL